MKDFIEEFYKDKRYRKIIYHRNFNPRLIEFITDAERISISSAYDYWNYVVNTLDNPKDIWDNCFKVQNNQYMRNLVKLVVFNGGDIAENDLKNSYNKLNKIENLNNTSHTEKDFQTASRLASKSFLNRNKILNGEVTYSLFNPSIADYILNEYNNDLYNITNIFKSLDTIKSLEQLLALEKQQIISKEHASELKTILFNDAFKMNKKLDYLIFISDLSKDDESKREIIIGKLLIKIIQNPVLICEFSKLLNLLEQYKGDLNLTDHSFLFKCIDKRELDEQEIEDLGYFLEFMEFKDDRLTDKLHDDLEAFLISELDSRKNDIDISDYVSFGRSYDGDISFDGEGIERELSSEIDLIMDGFYSDVISNLNIDRRKIINNIDVDKMIDTYISLHDEPDYDDDGSSAFAFTSDDIDDLFERS